MIQQYKIKASIDEIYWYAINHARGKRWTENATSKRTSTAQQFYFYTNQKVNN